MSHKYRNVSPEITLWLQERFLYWGGEKTERGRNGG
jgi:hypothetical protein